MQFLPIGKSGGEGVKITPIGKFFIFSVRQK